MNNIAQLHAQAMDLADQADLARQKRDLEAAQSLCEESFRLESRAASMISADDASEPSRSVFYRSAASLAIECGLWADAERMVVLGLSGYPPAEIAGELRELLERISFAKHLEEKGVSLGPDEVRLSIAGQAVGYGMAPIEEVLVRVEQVKRLVQRTVERLLGKPYREHGRIPSDAQGYDLYLTAVLPGSMCMSLKVGQPIQTPLPGIDFAHSSVEPTDVVDEILSCLELYVADRTEELRGRIPSESYRRNFVALAKSIAPDGSNVRTVDFTATRHGKRRSVTIRQSRQPLKSDDLCSEGEPGGSGQFRTIVGVLRFADSTTGRRPTIKLVDDEHQTHRVHVPEGMMSDIVKPLWEERVEVSGRYRRNVLLLDDIRRAL